MYELPCTVTLAESASLLDVLIIASRGSLEGLKADVNVLGAFKKDGIIRAPIKFRDLDLAEFSK